MHAILLLILLIPSVESVKWLEMWEPVPFLEGFWEQTISELLDSTNYDGCLWFWDQLAEGIGLC